MPYAAGKRFERASPLGHVPTISHPLVQERLGHYRRPASRAENVSAIKDLLVDPKSLLPAAFDAEYVMAVDGSPFEHEIDPAFPSTRSLFLQVAGVLVDLQLLRERRGPFADPSMVADAQEASVFAGFLPSSNLVATSGVLPVHAFREELHLLFTETTAGERPLMETFFDVEAERSPANVGPGLVSVAVCPNRDCAAEIKAVGIRSDGGSCPNCSTWIYPTDALRIHEAFRPYGSNLEAAGRVMTVAEHLTYLAFLLHVFEKQRATLKHIAFITDGPLAIFGEPASLRFPFLRLLQTRSAQMTADGHSPPLILGVEKTGEFVEHAAAIRQHIPLGTLMKLPSDYISDHIRYRDAPYGTETYYGRKFIYRTGDDRMLVLTVPPLAAVGTLAYTKTDTLDLNDYPTLRASCELLDKIGTRLFDDALIPIALAHHWAAFPLRTAGKVLKLHVERHLGVDS